ncbi:phage tail fiber protein [Paenibacillus silvae]|uniref:Uncharacterized protein n=1 Tax=Paenibacillus silvae TaxID=1325358 RepID=A0A2W6NE86_9BACL|nr:hypothetical protein [Paenibacillus silvae]PZT54131.1 hypothetical protein DN757_19060 [Paenibacillus silvae]
MANIGKFLATKILNTTTRGEQFVFPDQLYVGLYTSNPTFNDTGQEVNGGSYVRKIVSFDAPVQTTVREYHPKTGALSDIQKLVVRSSADTPFDVASGNWGVVTHFALRDAATDGNLYYYGELENPRSILTNDIFKFLASQVEIRLSLS